MRYVIGTRGSKLAVAQADMVCKKLSDAFPNDTFDIRIIKTKGDLILDKPLNQIGDKGVFVKEIEQEILEKKADIGVHSMKDMPACPAPGLIFATPWEREDPRDVLILREKPSLWELPPNAAIGTGSTRRACQLRRLRPDLQIATIRGNIDTRLRIMEEKKLDGIVLAAAGLHRLGLQAKITQYMDIEEMIPAPAQGILALEIRESEKHLLEMLNSLSDAKTAAAARAERGFLQEMGGSCHVPVGAVCTELPDGRCQLDSMFGNEREKWTRVSVQGSDPAALAKEAAMQIRRQIAGTVSLVGAGPGEPDLITVKGLLAIKEADCIIYDRLASTELLKEAKPGCEMIYVGKASHNHTKKQEEINRLLVLKSMEHEKTVRLKGGDPYVFGRGGEETLYLKSHGVTCEIIPGISSCIAGPAYAGIPITHRGMSHGFHVVTAHDKDDRLADLDFEAMAKGKETCVFLMGLSKIHEIANRLMEAGMPGHTPAAVISKATTPDQKTCVSDLAHIAHKSAQEALVSPAMIVVGNVVTLQEELNCPGKRALTGKRYLIPKIGQKPTRLKELLTKQGAAVDEIQTGEILPVELAFTAGQFADVDWLIFTSKNGVEAFFQNLLQSGLDVRDLAGCQIAAIGNKTALSLQAHGIHADLIPEHFHSSALADELKKAFTGPPNLMPEHFHSSALADELKKAFTGPPKVWYIKAGNAGSHLQEALADSCTFEEITVYENRPVKLSPEDIRPFTDYDGILFTCASSAERLLQIQNEGTEYDISQCSNLYSIGPKTSKRLQTYGIHPIMEAEKCDYEGLVDAILAQHGNP